MGKDGSPGMVHWDGWFPSSVLHKGISCRLWDGIGILGWVIPQLSPAGSGKVYVYWDGWFPSWRSPQLWLCLGCHSLMVWPTHWTSAIWTQGQFYIVGNDRCGRVRMSLHMPAKVWSMAMTCACAPEVVRGNALPKEAVVFGGQIPGFSLYRWLAGLGAGNFPPWG